MDHSGNSYTETSPFDPDGFSLSSKEEDKSETEEEEEVVDEQPPTEQSGMDDDKTQREVSGVQSPERVAQKVIEDPEVKSKSDRKKRPVTIMLPVEEKEEGKRLVTLRSPMRSATMRVKKTSPSATDNNKVMRRKSLVMLRRGHTGEGGSAKFMDALKMDSINEVHPGWESIKKLTRVVG